MNKINAYIKEKLKILNELYINLSYDELEHIKSLKTEHDVDRYAHDLIFRPLRRNKNVINKEHNTGDYYTVKEIADLLGLSAETINRWIRTGKLSAKFRKPNCKKYGYLIHMNDVVVFFNSYPRYKKSCDLSRISKIIKI